jgi:hypothetical protein
MVVLATCSTDVGILVAERNIVHPVVRNFPVDCRICCRDVSCVSILIDLFDCVNYFELYRVDVCK